MQIINKVSFFIALLFLTGCTSVYTINDYPSREKFYADFNDFAIDKNVRVKLNNDSLYNSIGVVIVNDTLYSLGHFIEDYHLIIPVSEIKDLEYKRLNSNKGTIVLKDGEKFSADRIKISRDSIDFYSSINVSCRKSISTLDRIKEVRYNSKWGNIGTKILAGTVLGAVTGFTVGRIIDDHNITPSTGKPDGSGQDDGIYTFYSCIIGVPLGALTGFIVGLYTGYNYIYRFN